MVSITELATSVGAVEAPYGWSLIFDEDLEAGDYVVLLGMHRAQPATPILSPSPLTDSVGNSYGYSYYMPTGSGRPLTWIAHGLVQVAAPAGTYMRGLHRDATASGPVYPELARAYRLVGAELFTPEGAAVAGGDPGGTGGPHATWSLGSIAAPSTQRERVLVGVIGCGHSDYGEPAVDSGSIYGSPTPLEHEDVTERWSCLHLTAISFADEPTAHSVSGSFGVTQTYWTGAHQAFRPLFAGRGNRYEVLRTAAAGRLVSAATGSPVAGHSACVSLAADRAGVLSVVGCGQPTGAGYVVSIAVNRRSGGGGTPAWPTATLYSYAEPASEMPGYQVVRHLQRSRGEAWLALYRHRERTWYLDRGRPVAGAWEVADAPELLAEQAAGLLDMSETADGRLLIGWLSYGSLVRLQADAEPICSHRAVMLLAARAAPPAGGWAAAGAAAPAVLDAPEPWEDAGGLHVPCWDGLRLCMLRDGRLLLLVHQVIYTLTAELAIFESVHRTLLYAARPDGAVDWEATAAGPLPEISTAADGALLQRRDGVVEWHYRALGTGAAGVRRARRLAAPGPWA